MDNEYYLVLCYKPQLLSQFISLPQVFPEINIKNNGENVIVVGYEKLSSDRRSRLNFEVEVCEMGLSNSRVVFYEPSDKIYKGDFSSWDNIQVVLNSIRKKIPFNITSIFTGLMSQRFTKSHFEAFEKSSIYLLEDGIRTYLEIPTKFNNTLVQRFAYYAIDESHMKRVKKVCSVIPDINIPTSHYDVRYLDIDFSSNEVEELKKSENMYLSLNKRRLSLMHNSMILHWSKLAKQFNNLERAEALLIAQSLDSVSRDFYFRDEVELYIRNCNELLKRFDKVYFAAHPKNPRIAEFVKKGVSKPDNVICIKNINAPIESLFFSNNAPSYVFGYYSSSMWYIKDVIGLQDVYTLLGWETRELYEQLHDDIQKQAYRLARNYFYPLAKLVK